MDRFRRIDQNNKNYIDASDLQVAFSTPASKYPIVGARMLLRLFADGSQMNFEQFVSMSKFIQQVLIAFKRHSPQGMQIAQFRAAIQELGIFIEEQTAISMYQLALDMNNNRFGLLEFQFVVVFLKLGEQLFASWTGDGDGLLHIGYERMLCLLMWFM
ncbi:EF-hand_protein [Hexamita inflata]|uniref:EF-hand protein n=1 Tax=Hexamita inflata TaxID=28002 RepID=A0AA86R595_9EUKA|nr:EF-hand protein [Hexamita inflata]